MTQTNSLVFILGSTPALSRLELEAILPQVTWQEWRPDILVATDLPEQINGQILDAQTLIDKLGGTVKILQLRTDLSLPAKPQAANLEKIIVDDLATHDKKAKFAVAELGRDHLAKADISRIKKGLDQVGISSRYFDGGRYGLSAAVLLHKKDLVEYYFIQNQTGEVLAAQTMAVQDIDQWTARDRAKPYADRKKGMLPPKVARMMVNLALGEQIWLDRDTAAAELSVYDPFCGTGTVALETMMVGGARLAASDLDVRAVLGTQENVAWLQEKENFEPTTQLTSTTREVANVELPQISPDGQKITHLVTEPFLGKQTPQAGQLEGIYRGLTKLYLGAFKNWTKLLVPGATLTVVFPLVQLENDRKTYSLLNNLIDKLAALGYTMSFEPVIYARPGAVVKRQIVGLKWQPR